ncbi:MAG: hypothetical protein KDB24_16655 [Microthrixaceae bacterium]|nr:hypothetical protein [Microthrixaceae bacterium]
MTATEVAPRRADTPPLEASRSTGGPHRSTRPLGGPIMVVSALWLAAVTAATLLKTSEAVHRAALFVHLAALLAGFGAVLVSDLYGVLWLTGRRRLGHLLSLHRAVGPMIWLGLIGLVGSGVLLSPNPTVPRTALKMVLVLIATINGIAASRHVEQLEALPPASGPHEVPTRLLVTTLAAGAISQACWWGATLVGFLSTTS